MRRFPRKIVAATTLGVLTLARLRHARRRGLVRAITTFTTPDGKPWVATLGRGRFVSVWDAGSGRRLRRLPVSDGPVHVAAFASSTGTPRLAVLAGNRSIQFWDPETGDRVGELRVSETAPGSRLATWRTPSGRPRIAVICGDGGIRVLDPEAGEGNEVPLIGHEGAATDLATWRKRCHPAVGPGDRARGGAAGGSPQTVEQRHRPHGPGTNPAGGDRQGRRLHALGPRCRTAGRIPPTSGGSRTGAGGAAPPPAHRHGASRRHGPGDGSRDGGSAPRDPFQETGAGHRSSSRRGAGRPGQRLEDGTARRGQRDLNRLARPVGALRVGLDDGWGVVRVPV